MANVNVSQMMPYTDYGAELEDLKRRQAYAELLRAQSMKPLQGAGMAGRTVAPISHAQGLAQMLQAANAGLESQNVSQERKALSARAEADRMNTLQKMAAQLRGQPQVGAPASVENIIDEQAMGGEGAPAQIMAPQTPNYQPAIPPDRMGAAMTGLGSQNPVLQQMGAQTFLQQMQPKKPIAVGHSLMDETGRVLGTDPTYAHEQAANREARTNDIIMRLADQRITAQERNALMLQLRQMGIDSQQALARLTASLRPERPEPAPTLRDIIDPLKTDRMITVDTRVYKPGTSLGAPGVIGIAGKEPGAAKRDETKQRGIQSMKETVSMLDSAYGNLEASGAGVDPKQNVFKNIWERASASGVGQHIAGYAGTEAQTQRDVISNARAALMAGMKEATGMSAQALNSNAELTFYMNMATDPTKSRPANRAALAYLDRRFGLGLGLTADPTAAKALAAQAPRATQQTTPTQTPGAGGAVKINSEAEYDALPSGSRYIDPSGNERVKR